MGLGLGLGLDVGFLVYWKCFGEGNVWIKLVFLFYSVR